MRTSILTGLLLLGGLVWCLLLVSLSWRGCEPRASVPREWPCAEIRLISGEVPAPGLYCLAEGQTEQHVLERAGVEPGTCTGGFSALGLRAVQLNVRRTTTGCEILRRPLPGPALLALELPLDLNRATIEELEALPHIGPGMARRIVADRERNGPFPEVAALDRVAGIGPATLRRLAKLLEVKP